MAKALGLGAKFFILKLKVASKMAAKIEFFLIFGVKGVKLHLNTFSAIPF